MFSSLNCCNLGFRYLNLFQNQEIDSPLREEFDVAVEQAEEILLRSGMFVEIDTDTNH